MKIQTYTITMDSYERAEALAYDLFDAHIPNTLYRTTTGAFIVIHLLPTYIDINALEVLYSVIQDYRIEHG